MAYVAWMVNRVLASVSSGVRGLDGLTAAERIALDVSSGVRGLDGYSDTVQG